MAKVDSWKLTEFFKRFAPRYLLGTTYTASPAFFETTVLPKIDRSKLEGAVVLCDPKGFRMASQEVGALRSVSKIYSLVYPHIRGAFHPKVWIMADSERLALLCGSGNMTQSGFIGNLELFDAFEVERGGEDQELAGEIVSFIEGLISLWPESEVRERPGLRSLEGMLKLARQIRDSNTPAADRSLWFLSSFGGAFGPQLSSILTCSDLKVASPYFGAGTKGVQGLRESLGNPQTEIFPALHSEGIDFDPNQLQSWQDGGPYQLEIQHSKRGKKWRFAHLKLYGLAGDGQHYSLTGSINATDLALRGPNCEAAILRRLDEESYQALFATRELDDAPEQEHLDYSNDGPEWLGIHAVRRGGAVHVSVDQAHQDKLPLKDVQLQWICGPCKERGQLPEVFTDSPKMVVRGDELPKWLVGERNAAGLEITGLTVEGKAFRSFCLIESYAELIATPMQRNAAAAVRAMMSDEEVPAIGDLSAVFQLLSRVAGDRSDSLAKAGKSAKKQVKQGRAPVIPIWPPVAAGESKSPYDQSVDHGDIEWVQTILSTLLHGNRSRNPTTDLPDNADMEGEKPSGKAARPTSKSAPVSQASKKIRLWRLVEQHYEAWESQTRQAVVYARPGYKGKRSPQFEMPHKERLVPVAGAILLMSLRLHPGDAAEDADEGMITRNQLIASFLRALIGDRPQPEGFSLPSGHPYQSAERFPPVIEDIVMDPENELQRDFAVVLAGLFVVLHAEGPQRSFPLIEWLKFKHFTAQDFVFDELTQEEVIEQAERNGTLGDLQDAHDSYKESLKAMLSMSWSDFIGFRKLQVIHTRLKGGECDENLTANIQYWDLFESRISRRGPDSAISVVSRFYRRCNQSGCQNAGLRVASIQPLEGLVPCICPACGTALIPELLNQVFQAHGD